jgi:hypothetical protein
MVSGEEDRERGEGTLAWRLTRSAWPPPCNARSAARDDVELDVDGLQHTLQGCERCGFELDLADRSAPRLGGADLLGLGVTGLALFALLAIASSLDEFAKMAGDFGSELPALTRATLRYQLPLPFLLASGLVAGVGAWRTAKELSRGRVLLWLGCALAVAGAVVCALGLYLPVFEIAGQLQEE